MSVKKFTLTISVFVIYSLTCQTVKAQMSDTDKPTSFTPSFSISGSYAPYSFRAWGKMLNTRHLFLKLGYSHSEFHLFSIRTHLSSELIMTGWLQYPLDGRSGDRETLFGFGMIPLIANMPLSRGNHYPFITSSLGFIVTQNHFPNLNGARFNFLLGTGAGYHIKTGPESAVQFGYKIHHLSNGYMANENPGIDSVMLFVNILFNP